MTLWAQSRIFLHFVFCFISTYLLGTKSTKPQIISGINSFLIVLESSNISLGPITFS